MNLFSRFGKKGNRFISEAVFKKNISSQLTMSPQTLEALRAHGVKDSDLKKLEFFFYTNTEAKAAALASTLMAKKYEVEYGISAGDDNNYLVTGWTTPLQMDMVTVLDWTKAMCELGYENDCDFDGWGTNAP